MSGSISSGATSDVVRLSHTMTSMQCVLHGRRDFVVIKATSSVPKVGIKHPQVRLGFCSLSHEHIHIHVWYSLVSKYNICVASCYIYMLFLCGVLLIFKIYILDFV